MAPAEAPYAPKIQAKSEFVVGFTAIPRRRFDFVRAFLFFFLGTELVVGLEADF